MINKIDSLKLKHLVRKYLVKNYYLNEEVDVSTQSKNYPYDELKKNPTNEFITKILFGK